MLIGIYIIIAIQILTLAYLGFITRSNKRIREEIRMIHMRMRTSQPGIRWRAGPSETSMQENKLRGEHPELWQWEPAPADQAHNLRRLGSAMDEQARLMEAWASEGQMEGSDQAQAA